MYDSQIEKHVSNKMYDSNLCAAGVYQVQDTCLQLGKVYLLLFASI